MTATRSVVLLAAFFIAMHALVLRPDGFFSGDQGPKYLQARAFARHGPLHPGIEVLSRDVDPEYRHQDPILRNRDGRLVATFSWLLPLLSAPFVAAMGAAGTYVVPAAAAIVIFLLAASFGRRLDEGAGVFIGWCAVLAAPTLFYGLESWEHAPAAAAVLAVALLLRPDDELAVGASRWRFAAAGACAAAGGLFREEAMLAWPAFLFARAVVSRSGARARNLVGAIVWSAAGAAVVLLLTVPGNRVVYGSLLPLHLTSEVEKTTAYWPMRVAILKTTFSPTPSPESLLYTWPFVFGLAALPFLSWDPLRRALARFVTIGALAIVAGTLAIIPTPGGAQWGPRYLFAAAPLLAAVVGAGARESRREARAATWFVRVTLACALAADVAGVVYLAGAKARNARIVARVEALTREQDVIVSDIPWFPEVTAQLLERRRILFARGPSEVAALAADAVRRGFRETVVVSSLSETLFAPPPELTQVDAGCDLIRVHRDSIGERGLVAYRYGCSVAGAVLK